MNKWMLNTNQTIPPNKTHNNNKQIQKQTNQARRWDWQKFTSALVFAEYAWNESLPPINIFLKKQLTYKCQCCSHKNERTRTVPQRRILHLLYAPQVVWPNSIYYRLRGQPSYTTVCVAKLHIPQVRCVTNLYIPQVVLPTSIYHRLCGQPSYTTVCVAKLHIPEVRCVANLRIPQVVWPTSRPVQVVFSTKNQCVPQGKLWSSVATYHSDNI